MKLTRFFKDNFYANFSTKSRSFTMFASAKQIREKVMKESSKKIFTRLLKAQANAVAYMLKEIKLRYKVD